jgi:peptidoglycan lytic transglycosylase G
VVERRPGVIPPRPRPPRRTPRAVVYRRRLVAIAVLVAGFLIAWFAVGSIGGGNTPSATAPVVPRPFKVVFPEGFTREQMAGRVAAVTKIAERKRGRPPLLTASAYLAATSRPRRQAGFGRRRLSLEGFLFPATYDFTVRTTSAQLVAAQLVAFQRNWGKLDLGYASSKNLTPYDVLTIASLVEKEAAAPEERPKIARVIYNRLHARMNLGIDATTRYGLHVPPTKSLTQSELQSDNPYNTRNPNITGLPPTPIANPGLASIQAAAHPAPGPWLYFVRKPDHMHHFFTASSAAFERYKAAHGY